MTDIVSGAALNSTHSLSSSLCHPAQTSYYTLLARRDVEKKNFLCKINQCDNYMLRLFRSVT